MSKLRRSEKHSVFSKENERDYVDLICKLFSVLLKNE